jgi:drug/metabolite transporter (DMT)-like permease
MNAIVACLGALPLFVIGAPSVARTDWLHLPMLTWLAVGYSVLASQIIANTIWYRSISALGPSRAGMYSNLEPFLGALFAVLVLNEALSLEQLCGGLIIALAIVASVGVRDRYQRQPLADMPRET